MIKDKKELCTLALCMTRNLTPNARMRELDHILNGYGVEHIWGERDGHTCVVAEYVNMGDTYATTVMRVGKRFQVCSWGDWVEKNGRKYKVQ